MMTMHRLAGNQMTRCWCTPWINFHVRFAILGANLGSVDVSELRDVKDSGNTSGQPQITFDLNLPHHEKASWGYPSLRPS